MAILNKGESMILNPHKDMQLNFRQRVRVRNPCSSPDNTSYSLTENEACPKINPIWNILPNSQVFFNNEPMLLFS